MDGVAHIEVAEHDEALIESTDDPRAWLFSDAELRATPAAECGLEKGLEKWVMTQLVAHVEQLGAELSVPQLAISVAIKLMQRYLMLESITEVVAPACLPAAALFLACKMQECPRRLRQIVIVSYRIRIRSDSATLAQLDAFTASATAAAEAAQVTAGNNLNAVPVPPDAFAMPNALFRRERDAVLHHEQAILRAVAFDLHVEHPYKYIMELIEAFADCRDSADKRSVTQISWNFLNDSFRTLSHLRFTEKEIASAALLLASRFCGVGLKPYVVSAQVLLVTDANAPTPSPERITWWQYFELDAERIMQAANMMLDSYDSKPP